MEYTTEYRNERVRKVLAEATEPIGPTEIARIICEPWCFYFGTRPHENFAKSAAITPVLKRIKAVRHDGGKYTKPV